MTLLGSRRVSTLGITMAVFAGACVPARTLRGTVAVDDRACGGADAGAATPRSPGPGVTVRVECPKGGGGTDKVVALELEVDASGRFGTTKAPAIPLECEIVVAGGSTRPRRFAVSDYCTSDYAGPIWDSHEGACHNLWLDARLLPLPAPREPGEGATGEGAPRGPGGGATGEGAPRGPGEGATGEGAPRGPHEGAP
ncbi:MAG: hypothetical protein KF850_21405 [Labilithrix sp.]|nr:hypothetical protein [Labilithrix sp.]